MSSLRMVFSFRRIVHSFAYFIATLVAVAVFALVLMLAESLVYALTGEPVSLWSMVIAAIAAGFGYAPLVQAMQRMLDRMFFRHQLDTLAAIRQLGAGDLAQLPEQDVERALLERICKVCYRRYAALDERQLPEGGWYSFPADAPKTDADDASGGHEGYALCLPLPAASGEAWLWLGPRIDGSPMDAEERSSLDSLAKFAAMSLEHARLTHHQSEAARLDSLSRVTKQLHSHDLKNRLHDLSFLAHHLGSGKLDDEDVQRMLAAIRKVTGRMQTLMQRMSDPNAPVEPVLAPLDLVAILRSSIRDRLWPEAITIDQCFDPLPAVAGDADLLQGVIENLYDNAVQAMQGQGVITVRARLLEAGTASDVPMAQIQVVDQGAGMSEYFIRQRLFHLFATSKSNGLGIGLYLSRRIVEAHGGTITAESEGAGKGSTFSICLPLWQSGHQQEE
ncbi:ATP-binding protein [Mariprofundus ferrooxydans]|uniref:histidine kinase n=1 Tax=Mariprofundus ferrooxydans PV-1 TaxID=314345 RepID=Q0EYP2_9PROT|nr:ATP-binding protein [Mariprofundus ferrooxydans]EAU54325.1 PAS/PAC Sensor Hybrid Histidine Kinase [Mariprofundus ferrooxydans PV-1]KON47448.1 histidine kinase [Mariprofundus ferrooxydans]